jgi:hypothetical protein
MTPSFLVLMDARPMPTTAPTPAPFFGAPAVVWYFQKTMRARAVIRRVVLVLASVVLAVVAAAGEARAQDGFRISYDVDRTRPDRARLTGRILNERAEDVFEVSVTAEALDSRGKVLGRGISYVDARIGRGDGRPFSMSVPTAAGTASFRVVVSSFKAGFGQAPSQSQGP